MLRHFIRADPWTFILTMTQECGAHETPSDIPLYKSGVVAGVPTDVRERR